MTSGTCGQDGGVSALPKGLEAFLPLEGRVYNAVLICLKHHVSQVACGLAIGPEWVKAGILKASRDRSALSMTEEDLGLDKLQARRVEGFELLFRVRLSWLKGRHGGVRKIIAKLSSVSLCNPLVGSCIS